MNKPAAGMRPSDLPARLARSLSFISPRCGGTARCPRELAGVSAPVEHDPCPRRRGSAPTPPPAGQASKSCIPRTVCAAGAAGAPWVPRACVSGQDACRGGGPGPHVRAVPARCRVPGRGDRWCRRRLPVASAAATYRGKRLTRSFAAGCQSAARVANVSAGAAIIVARGVSPRFVRPCRRRRPEARLTTSFPRRAPLPPQDRLRLAQSPRRRGRARRAPRRRGCRKLATIAPHKARLGARRSGLRRQARGFGHGRAGFGQRAWRCSRGG